jgi:hypothetical protein
MVPPRAREPRSVTVKLCAAEREAKVQTAKRARVKGLGAFIADSL